MPTTITKDNYQALYNNKFSKRGLSVLADVESQPEGLQKEKLKVT